VAEVQKLHAVWSMAQLRFEVYRALPVLKPGADGEAVVTEVARLAVSGRSGAEVVEVTAPDITDVTSLGVRASDGGSIYRPPNEERYCNLAHLDTEEQILATAKRTVPQFVSCEQAWASVECTGLNAEQRNVVVMMLTAAVATAVLVAPAGAGNSHTMAEFARLWTTFISILSLGDVWGPAQGLVDLGCREFGFHPNGMMLSPVGWRFVVVGHSSRRLACTVTASGCSQHKANRDGRLVVARVGLGELVMNVTRTIRYRDSAAGARALAGSSTAGAIRDGVWVGGITPLRPGGSGRDCED